MDTYRHTQIGWAILFGVGAAAVATLASAGSRPSTGYIVVLLALVLVLALFATLTVVGDEDGLDVRFGPGLVRKRFKWRDIRSDTPVRNSWLAGWGIRWIGSGCLFNVSGLDAVELSLKSGKVFRIGTDDPAGLHAFIQANLNGRALRPRDAGGADGGAREGVVGVVVRVARWIERAAAASSSSATAAARSSSWATSTSRSRARRCSPRPACRAQTSSRSPTTAAPRRRRRCSSPPRGPRSP